MTDKWLDREAVERLCPPCAEAMKKKGIKAVKASVIARNLADKIKTTFMGGSDPKSNS